MCICSIARLVCLGILYDCKSLAAVGWPRGPIGLLWRLTSLIHSWQLLHQVQLLLTINALPYMEREMVLHNTASQREAQAQFDTSRLVDLSEHIIFDSPAAQVFDLCYMFCVLDTN